MNPHSYNISVRRANFDGDVYFEARVRELPDVAEYADSADEAYNLAIDTITTTAEIFAEKGKSMPHPYEPAEDYSGRVTLRLSKSLHRSLSEGAEQEGVSLNQHLVNVLSYASGYCAGASNHSTPQYSASVPAFMNVKTVSSCAPHLHLVNSAPMDISRQSAGWE